MENFYDLTKVGKNMINREKRINEQAGNYLKEYNKKLEESLQAEEDKKNADAMSGARFGISSFTRRSNQRVNSLRESIEYENRSSIVGMTEMISNVVENALLLDESELVKIYPEYKKEIRETVKGFLENAVINDNITNEDTRNLMEYVYKKLPGVKEGISLTEDELANYIALNKPVDIDKSIRNLSGNVSSRVATLMEKEQKKNEEIEKDVKKAKKAAGIKDEEPVEEIEDPSIEEVPTEEAPIEGDAEEMPLDDEISADTTGMETMSTTPKKQIQMMPDGTMNINIYESSLVRETPRCGLFESLAVNEANNMLSEGKEYNADLCLSKAIMYITITEAMDEMGLMNVNDNMYANIIKSAGGKLIEASSGFKNAYRNDKPVDEKGNNKYTNYVEGKAKATAMAMSKAGNPIKKPEELGAVTKQAEDAYEKKAASASKKGLTESVYVQYNPIMNSKVDPNSLAERIRRRKLGIQNNNLNE